MANKRVLIIDDEPGIAMLVQVSLKAIAGWEVLIASSGKEGISVAIAEFPDAILLDMNMPEMDGITTFKQIQSNLALQSIPTILLTAQSQSIMQSQFTELGITGIIAKPFKIPDLVQQMRSFLKWEE